MLRKVSAINPILIHAVFTSCTNIRIFSMRTVQYEGKVSNQQRCDKAKSARKQPLPGFSSNGRMGALSASCYCRSHGRWFVLLRVPGANDASNGGGRRRSNKSPGGCRHPDTLSLEPFTTPGIWISTCLDLRPFQISQAIHRQIMSSLGFEKCKRHVRSTATQVRFRIVIGFRIRQCSWCKAINLHPFRQWDGAL